MLKTEILNRKTNDLKNRIINRKEHNCLYTVYVMLSK